MKKNMLFLLAMSGALTVCAQEKVPDMTRFSKAPLGPVATGKAAARTVAPQQVNGLPDMSRFTKAPVNQSAGNTMRSAARQSARVSATPVSLSSSEPAAGKPKPPAATPALPPAALEQEQQGATEKH